MTMHNGPTKLTMRNGEPALRKRVLYRRHSCASTPNHSPRAVIRRTERLSVEVVVGLRGRSAQRVTGKRSKNGCGVTRGSAPYFKGKELHLSRIHILRHGGTTGTLRDSQMHDKCTIQTLRKTHIRMTQESAGIRYTGLRAQNSRLTVFTLVTSVRKQSLRESTTITLTTGHFHKWGKRLCHSR